MPRNSRDAPREEYLLYNPAFLSLLLRRSSEGFERERTTVGMSTLLAYVAVSMSLRIDMRAALTMTVTSKLGTWTNDNAKIVTLIAPTCTALLPYLNNALMFGLNHRIFTLRHGRLHPTDQGPKKTISGVTSEVQDCQKAALYLGRWFALSGSESTVSALLGVRP